MSDDLSTEPIDEAIPTRDRRQLHAQRAGAGTPVVVFEAGMGASRNSWGAIAPIVAQRTTTVVYDRSGLGLSAPSDGPRDLAALVADLGDVLDHLGEGPFILIGHSWGGPIVRGAAVAQPDRIAGLVLVDQTDEGCDLFFSSANERTERWLKPIATVASKLGLLRLAVNRLAAMLPEPAATQMRAEDATSGALQTHQRELEGCTADLRRLRDDPPTLPSVPVSIISGTKSSRFGRKRRNELVAAHRARADALPLGRHVVAAASSHYVPFTDPQIVIDEILAIVEQLPDS